MTMLYTCGLCKNLVRHAMYGIILYSCKKTGCCVPQTTDKNKAVFHRVPMDCPLPDTESSKSEKPAARKHWVRVQAGRRKDGGG